MTLFALLTDAIGMTDIQLGAAGIFILGALGVLTNFMLKVNKRHECPEEIKSIPVLSTKMEHVESRVEKLEDGQTELRNTVNKVDKNVVKIAGALNVDVD